MTKTNALESLVIAWARARTVDTRCAGHLTRGAGETAARRKSTVSHQEDIRDQFEA
ncbi:hypothetical protein [Mycobacterium kiyosense]|nr:hypothetical protein IWGMT90018_36130 [Mycobacterium kiyosense]